MTATVDRDAYFQRIHWSGGRDPTLATLAELIKPHTTHIPFENLDVLLSHTVRLDLDGLQNKIGGARRGGYCFEHAVLLAAVLEALGFQGARPAAQVVLFGLLAEAKRDHMFMTASCRGRDLSCRSRLWSVLTRLSGAAGGSIHGLDDLLDAARRQLLDTSRHAGGRAAGTWLGVQAGSGTPWISKWSTTTSQLTRNLPS